MELCERLYVEYGLKNYARRMCRITAVLLLLCVLAAEVCEIPVYNDYAPGQTGNVSVGEEPSGRSKMKVRDLAAEGGWVDYTPDGEGFRSGKSGSEVEKGVMKKPGAILSGVAGNGRSPAVSETAGTLPGISGASVQEILPEIQGTSVQEESPGIPGSTVQVIKPSVPGAAGNAPSELPEDTEGTITENITLDEAVPQTPPADNDAAVPPVENSAGGNGNAEEDGADESAGSADGAVIINGFLVDEAGMVYGIDDAQAAVNGGVMTLPAEGCNGIARGAFLGISDMVYEIHIPANITCIEEGAFLGLGQVEWFEADAGNSACYSEDGVLFSEGGSCILAFPAARVGIYPVPAQVTRLARDAFADSILEKLITTDCDLTDTGNLPESIVVL